MADNISTRYYHRLVPSGVYSLTRLLGLQVRVYLSKRIGFLAL